MRWMGDARWVKDGRVRSDAGRYSGIEPTTAHPVAHERTEKVNPIDLFGNGKVLEGGEKERWEPLFEAEILRCQRCSFEGRGKEGVELDGVARSSDAFFPLPDNMHRARKSGIRCLAAPSGSVMGSRSRRWMSTGLCFGNRIP
ncbi:uncharacterized protein LACBIDRAFT_315043 [Laccaria bicolor S238N-H82]|uniref:Predicted protein n=1 Tax=Laccaria bicolor (strain S238N-H82 / ATCC MYA-4686) TaxID=486041 RepID=B0E550_LACBS|nr:uncharacterized protein LACBIDRAFT_315043 [Laccaria bicolor S238N-H82]EDQ98032.1 predicted protein [Laccaria bicolor S238N-H82]|eukprot:XP_001891319.1 predicted protein [Laccaria bicolor S238N-H82]